MIFTTVNIGAYNNTKGFKRKPISCTLQDGREGFYFDDNKATELTANGISFETITKEDLIEV